MTNESSEEEPVTVAVSNFSRRLGPHLSERARNALRGDAHRSLGPDMVPFARRFAGPPTDDEVARFGRDLSALVELLSRPVVIGNCSLDFEVDGLMLAPTEVPLEDGGRLVVLVARVAWAGCAEARAFLKRLALTECGVDALELGELPPVSRQR